MPNPAQDAVSALRQVLPRAQVCVPAPDQAAPSLISGGQPSSCPPWNGPAADVATTIHEGVRRLEASLARQVTGQPRRRRGGSAANTGLSLTQLEYLAGSLPAHSACPHAKRCRRCCCDCCRATRILSRWVTSAQLLPAIDEAVRWVPITGDPLCPYCSTPSLRWAQRLGLVACHNDACRDSDDRQPVARVGASARDGTAELGWQDGLVTG